MNKTMKISELIEILRTYRRVYGDKPVILSSDEEGNGFGTIGQDNKYGSFDVHHGFLVIYPYAERLELDEVEGYVEEDDDE